MDVIFVGAHVGIEKEGAVFMVGRPDKTEAAGGLWLRALDGTVSDCTKAELAAVIKAVPGFDFVLVDEEVQAAGTGRWARRPPWHQLLSKPRPPADAAALAAPDQPSPHLPQAATA